MRSKLKEQYNKIKLNDRKLYLIADSDEFDSDDKFLDVIASAISGGVEIVQLKGKNMPSGHIIELGKKIKQICAQFDATFILNDRADIALIVGADGVHLEQDAMDIKEAREILGENAIVGVSVHTKEQALKAVADESDYIITCSVFENETQKESVKNDYAKWSAKNITIPNFAIGGISLENCKKVFDIGLNRIVLESEILKAENPHDAVQMFLSKY